MPEHLRALIVVLFLAGLLFATAKTPACADNMAASDFERRRNVWFALTLAAFLAHNFWIYIALTTAVLVLAVGREHNKLAMFFFLLFAVPTFTEEIPGIGGIKHLFIIGHVRLLVLLVLFPAYLHLRAQKTTAPFGKLLPDKLLIAYVVLNLLLMFTVNTFTNALRQGLFYAFIDIVLPYYVATRSLKDLRDFRDVLTAFVVVSSLLALVAAFEAIRHWLLYAPVADALHTRWGYGGYLERGIGMLRAQGSTGHPIALGYVMVVGIGFVLYLRRFSALRLYWNAALLILFAGLVASVSRGPWVGAAAVVVAFAAFARSPATELLKVAAWLGLATAALIATSTAETVVDYLPFVGTVEDFNVTYRQRLLEISIQVILQNPFFGAFDYLYSPAMQELKQGEGIIDIVNTYLGVGLASGLVGLSLFSGFFIAVALGIFKRMRQIADRSNEHYVLGLSLLATLLGILVTIFTVSSITIIPIVYWAAAGIGVAYAQMVAQPESAVRAPTQTAAMGADRYLRPDGVVTRPVST
jgi:O-antigen ligase